MTITKDSSAAATVSPAVPGALLLALALALPVAAFADGGNPEVLALTQPANYVEIGALNVSDDSAKFGEYNGLDQSGVYAIGNFDFRGGDAYRSFDGGKGTSRWQIRGTDLGTTSRTLSGTVSDQGSWNLGVGYDELRHYSTDSYQTPFQGAMGGNVFSLPASFGVIVADHFGDPGSGTQALTATQRAAFHSEEVYSGRKNFNLAAGYILNKQWSLQFDFNRLDQSGAKLLAASFSPDASGAGAGENSATFMNPTRYKTDTFDFGINWVGDQGHLRAGYFVSLFHDDNASFSFSNPFADPELFANGDAPPGGAFPVNVYGTPPSNSFHQLNLTGGYSLSPSTSLAGGLSYGRNTQNSGYIDDFLQTAALPRSSLDGLVVNTHADLRLTNQATRNLVLTAGFKYNERDNQSPSNTYGPVTSIAGDGFGTVVNAPVSNRKTQIELAGNYRFDKRQSARLAYEYEAIKRWCNNALANNAQSTDPEGFPADYYTQAACVQVGENKENKLVASYKFRASDTLRLNAGYTHARRSADVNRSYYNPMQSSGEGFQNYGFVGYFDASRTEQIIKAGLNWQPIGALDLGLAVRYLDDKYDSTLGVQSGRSEAFDLDAAYSPAENVSLSAYLTLQQRKRDLLAGYDRSPTAPPTQIWSNNLSDDANTIGLTAKRGGLLHGKLQVLADASFSSGKSVYTTGLVSYASDLCSSTLNLTCGELPEFKNEVTRLRLTFSYQTTKTGTVALGYLYQKLTSNDYYYSAYQYGSTAVTVLPTNQQSPGYTVNVVGLSYRYTIR
jgi:MtrB/PioB family decaheme-associated outer membrane protein